MHSAVVCCLLWKTGIDEWLIVSGRDLGDLNKKGRHWEGNDSTALEIAREKYRAAIVAILERFLANPQLTRYEIQVKLGLRDVWF